MLRRHSRLSGSDDRCLSVESDDRGLSVDSDDCHLSVDSGCRRRGRNFDLLGSQRNLTISRIPEPAILNPWRRLWGPILPTSDLLYLNPEIKNPTTASFSDYNVNTGHDAYVKKAVLKVSPSVVGLISYSGGKKAFMCSGVIFGCFWNNDSLNYSVLTSATLLRPPSSHACDLCFELYSKLFEPEDDNCLPIDQKIDVYLRRGKLCEGIVVTYDLHYNIAVLTFKSDDRIPCAVLRPLDDTLALNNAPTDVQASPCHFPCLPHKLIPGDAVIAVGRFAYHIYEIMAAPGRYSADCVDEKTKLNCMDLFSADCKITKCGIGGPLISSEGEVIGLNFYAEDCTPFLPINIFLKWWSHHKVTRSHCRPSLGMKVANLHTADLGTLDQVQKLGISQGLIVQKVISGSPAESCDLRPGDVVFKCSDTMVVSPLQLFEIIWDMAGKTVEVAVVRDGSYENLKIEVKDITSADEFYQWPLPRTYEEGFCPQPASPIDLDDWHRQEAELRDLIAQSEKWYKESEKRRKQNSKRRKQNSKLRVV